MYVIRLNLIETDKDGNTKYRNKEISTGLKATKRNQIKANAMVNEEVSKYSFIGNNTLFDEYCLQWLERKKDEIEIVTYEGYQYRIRHITKYFKEHPIPIGSVSAEDVDKFYHYLLTKDKSCPSQKADKGLSNRTIKDIAVLLRTILSDAIILEHAKDKDKTLGAIKLKIPKRPEGTPVKAYIGRDEINTFLDAIKGHRLELPFLLAFYYGLRREEILGLKWAAIRNGRLFIEHTISRMKTTVAKDRTKTTASHRNYPIPEEIMEKLIHLHAIQQENQKLMGNCYHPSDYIFTWEDGRPYTPDYLSKSFKKLVRSNDALDNSLTLHSLRASCVSVLIHEGTDIKDVQEWIGHKDVQTTLNVYARTNQKQQKKVMNRMTNALLTTSV